MDLSILSDLHITQVLQILNSQLGENYITIEQLQSYQNNPNAVCLICVNEGEVLGVSIALIDSLENTSKQLLVGQDWFQSEFKESSRIALRKHMAVKPGFEGQGIGSHLVKESVRRLKALSDVIVTIVWKEGDGEVMNRLMMKNDFQSIRTIPDYWKQDSITHQYVCPECKVIPCTCSAVIYAL